MNPYQELNVSPDSTQDEIKKAYHRKAKKNHPDKGGKPEVMEAVNKAYAMIKDARSRDYYDKHGEEKKVDTELTQAVNIAFQIISGAIERNEENIEFYFQALKKQWQSEFNNHVRDNETKKKKIINFQKRIKNTPKNDFVNNFLTEQLRALDMNIDNLKNDWSARCRAFVMLSEYSFEEIQKMQTITFMTSATATASKPW